MAKCFTLNTHGCTGLGVGLDTRTPGPERAVLAPLEAAASHAGMWSSMALREEPGSFPFTAATRAHEQLWAEMPTQDTDTDTAPKGHGWHVALRGCQWVEQALPGSHFC